MTDVVSAEPTGGTPAPEVRRRRTLDMLAGARAEKLTGLVLPPGHEQVLDVVVMIWVDGVKAGMQLSDVQPPPCGLSDDLGEPLYDALEDAKLCSEYDEFPELDDSDFQDLAYRQVSKLGNMVQPAGHPEVTWDMVEIWMDGVGTALRVARDAVQRSA